MKLNLLSENWEDFGIEDPEVKTEDNDIVDLLEYLKIEINTYTPNVTFKTTIVPTRRMQNAYTLQSISNDTSLTVVMSSHKDNFYNLYTAEISVLKLREGEWTLTYQEKLDNQRSLTMIDKMLRIFDQYVSHLGK